MNYNSISIMINIIIPMHVSEQNTTIEECIRTIINNCSNFNNISNIIIVSSKKISIDLLSNINILIIYNKDAITRAKAMNIGFKSNKSRYCMFLHCDTLLPKSFDKLVISKLIRLSCSCLLDRIYLPHPFCWRISSISRSK